MGKNKKFKKNKNKVHSLGQAVKKEQEVKTVTPAVEVVNNPVAREVEQEVETPKAKRNYPERKPRPVRPVYEGMNVSLDLMQTKEGPYEKDVLTISYHSEDKKMLLELTLRQYLLAYEIREDMAPRILQFLWSTSKRINYRKTYAMTMQVAAEELDLSYTSIKKVMKKLIQNEIITKEEAGYAFTESAERFLETLITNKQIVLSFESTEE